MVRLSVLCKGMTFRAVYDHFRPWPILHSNIARKGGISQRKSVFMKEAEDDDVDDFDDDQNNDHPPPSRAKLLWLGMRHEATQHSIPNLHEMAKGRLHISKKIRVRDQVRVATVQLANYKILTISLGDPDAFHDHHALFDVNNSPDTVSSRRRLPDNDFTGFDQVATDVVWMQPG